eukprot:3658640-Pyramimonas_sp.AAC.1
MHGVIRTPPRMIQEFEERFRGHHFPRDGNALVAPETSPIDVGTMSIALGDPRAVTESTEPARAVTESTELPRAETESTDPARCETEGTELPRAEPESSEPDSLM